MRSFYPILIGLILCSCGGEEVQEVVELEDLIGDVGEVEEDTSESIIDTSVVVNGQLSALISTMIKDYDTTSHEEFHPIDRFNFSSEKKIKFIGKKEVPYGKSNMVIPKAKMFYYTFADTVKTNNAFYNWLDCFGGECDVVELHKDMEAIKMPPLFTVVYDTTIIVMEYLCEHEKNDWDSFQDSIIREFGQGYKYMIDVDCGGPLKWK